jgi:hypothetical protein
VANGRERWGILKTVRRMFATIIVCLVLVLASGCSSSSTGSPSSSSKSYNDGYAAGRANVTDADGAVVYSDGEQACLQLVPLAPAGDQQGQFMSGCQAGWNSAKSEASSTQPVTSSSSATTTSSLPVSGWSHGQQIEDGDGELVSVSCASATFCMAVDEREPTSGEGGDNAYTYSNGNWSSAQMIANTNNDDLAVVACVSPSWCMAIGNGFYSNGDGDNNDAYAFIYADGKWGGIQQVTTSGVVENLSCASASFCVAVGYGGFPVGGAAYVYSGGVWAPRQEVESSEVLDAVSCPSSTFCTAVGQTVNGQQAGDNFIYQSGHWSTGPQIAPNSDIDEMTGISCTSPSFCMAVDDANAYVYAAGTWSKSYSLPDGNQTDVSCASPSFCGVADGLGEFIDSGGRWTNSSGSSESVSSSISCPSTSFCVGVSMQGGTAYSYSQ